ncbi:MAG: DUF421 domain-containing protein [Longimicrobiales bacterium]
METVLRVLLIYAFVLFGLRVLGKRAFGELTLVFITTLLSYLFPKFGTIMSGEPTTVAAHGSLRPERMHEERVPPEEILDAMHRSGLETMEQVKWAVLYPDGTIAVVPWREPDPGRRQQDSERAL